MRLPMLPMRILSRQRPPRHRSLRRPRVHRGPERVRPLRWVPRQPLRRRRRRLLFRPHNLRHLVPNRFSVRPRSQSIPRLAHPSLQHRLARIRSRSHHKRPPRPPPPRLLPPRPLIVRGQLLKPVSCSAPTPPRASQQPSPFPEFPSSNPAPSRRTAIIGCATDVKARGGLRPLRAPQLPLQTTRLVPFPPRHIPELELAPGPKPPPA